VLREALALVGAGVVIGFLASFAATKTVSTLLFGVLAVTELGATLTLETTPLDGKDFGCLLR
jgi:uncharacterized membrane protein (Fun14 family)